MRVGFLGDGHINSVVRDAVEQSRPYRIVGTFGRDDAVPAGIDVVVEAATQQAVLERVPSLLAEGVDVILLSVGALADAALRTTLFVGSTPASSSPAPVRSAVSTRCAHFVSPARCTLYR